MLYRVIQARWGQGLAVLETTTGSTSQHSKDRPVCLENLVLKRKKRAEAFC
jgi:hypothetical protein